jgi:hypothetical protein
MSETEQTGKKSDNSIAAGAPESAVLKPIKALLFLLPLAMGAAWYAGGEIANGEISQYRAANLEQNTAECATRGGSSGRHAQCARYLCQSQ